MGSTPSKRLNQQQPLEAAGLEITEPQNTHHELDFIARKPFLTYQLGTVAISKKREFLEELPEESCVIWSHQVRVKIVERVISLVKEYNIEQAIRMLDTLTKDLCGGKLDTKLFHVDDKSALLITHLSILLINDKTDFYWMETFENYASMLQRHLSLPVLRGHFPLQDTGMIRALNLTGVKLHKNDDKYFRLLIILKHNPSITTLDLSFTGLSPERAKDLMLFLTNRKQLTTLGLRGNRLDTTCVDYLDRIMMVPDLLPKLYWVDMRNNLDIIYYPDSLLESFRMRLPLKNRNVNLRELAEGRTVILDEDEMEGPHTFTSPAFVEPPGTPRPTRRGPSSVKSAM